MGEMPMRWETRSQCHGLNLNAEALSLISNFAILFYFEWGCQEVVYNCWPTSIVEDKYYTFGVIEWKFQNFANLLGDNIMPNLWRTFIFLNFTGGIELHGRELGLSLT